MKAKKHGTRRRMARKAIELFHEIPGGIPWKTTALLRLLWKDEEAA